MKNKSGGWYHSTTTGVAGSIQFFFDDEYLPDGFQSGPFKSFRLAQKDAIQYHQTDISYAKLAIIALKSQVAVERPPRGPNKC